jgi:hypothetical protein
LPRILQRRAEVAAARTELDHLDRELADLEQALKHGDAKPRLCCEGTGTDDSADAGQCSCV